MPQHTPEGTQRGQLGSPTLWSGGCGLPWACGLLPVVAAWHAPCPPMPSFSLVVLLLLSLSFPLPNVVLHAWAGNQQPPALPLQGTCFPATRAYSSAGGYNELLGWLCSFSSSRDSEEDEEIGPSMRLWGIGIGNRLGGCRAQGCTAPRRCQQRLSWSGGTQHTGFCRRKCCSSWESALVAPTDQAAGQEPSKGEGQLSAKWWTWQCSRLAVGLQISRRSTLNDPMICHSQHGGEPWAAPALCLHEHNQHRNSKSRVPFVGSSSCQRVLSSQLV